MLKNLSKNKKIIGVIACIVVALAVTFLTAFALVLLSTALGAYGATFFVGNALIYYWLAYAIYSIMLIGGAFNAITKALTNNN